MSEKIRTEIKKFEEQNWERLCEKSKTDHRATAKMWRKIKNINNTSIHLDNINIKIDGINSPTEQEMADCFGKTLESTFQLDTDIRASSRSKIVQNEKTKRERRKNNTM